MFQCSKCGNWDKVVNLVLSVSLYAIGYLLVRKDGTKMGVENRALKQETPRLKQFPAANVDIAHLKISGE